MKKLNAKGKVVLCFGDTHFPYHHLDIYTFLEAVKKKYSPYIIINMGDELDNSAISFYDSDQELFSAGQELELAIGDIKTLEKIFPKQYVLESNHSSLVFRRMKKHGIPIAHMKTLKEILGTKKWSWHDEIILTTNHDLQTYLCHGKTNAYGKLAKEVGMNAVQGHAHTKFEVTWHKTVLQDRYNAFCGCLINHQSLAYAYGRNNVAKAILGCLIINKQGMPHLVKMNLDKHSRWDGKL